MANKKRTRSGQMKAQNEDKNRAQINEDVSMADTAPTCAQPQLPSSNSTDSGKPQDQSKTQKTHVPKPETARPAESKPNEHRQKLPRLPKNAKITKRPLLHPAIPTPYSSSSSPKVLYITLSSPFIPSIKRTRRLLNQIAKREKQSLGSHARNNRRKPKPLQANGRLRNQDVEANIAAEAAAARSQGGRAATGNGVVHKEREKVYLKASGRAIPRALQIGVHFQGDADCAVRVEMGNVKAIDDIEVCADNNEGGEGGGVKLKKDDDEDVPETRIRTVSCVTVSIWLK